MSLSKYLLLMIIATIFCWAAFLIVINAVNPLATVALGYALFYVSLFCALVGTLSVIGFLVRFIFNKNQFIIQQVKTSFRQGVWFAILVVGGLYLQSQGLVAWWNLLIFVVLLVVVEIFFVSSQKSTA